MSESTTDTTTDTVAVAFDALLDAMGKRMFGGGSMANLDMGELVRVGEFAKAVMPLRAAWVAGLPASGKVAGKRGRKAKNANGDASEGSDGTESTEVSETQVETSAPPTGRSRRANA